MSESRRNKLQLIMFGLMVFGLIAIARVFVTAWKHPANAGADLIRFDPSKLETDQLVVLDRGDEGDFKYKFIILNTNDGFKVFGIEGTDNAILMPWFADRELTGSCEHLAVRDKLIHCTGQRYDASKDEWWQWNFNGKNISGKAPDLPKINFNYDGNVITIGRK